MRQITLAATQFACSWDLAANADTAEALVIKAGREGQAGLTASFDLATIADLRASWGLFRDRRPATCAAINRIGA